MLEYSEKKLTQAELTAFEQEHQIELPKDYKAFILANNGGIPPDNRRYTIVELDGDEVELGIASFHPIKYGNYTVKSALFYLVETEIIPAHFLPFGDNGGEAELCISLREEEHGAVYYMALDSDVLFPIKLATNFTAFLQNLGDGEI
ncbi:MAG: SMI1/KNR4 family protein [Aureispira sp.]